MNTTKITVYLYPTEYGVNNLTNAILNKKFGFELSFESDNERNRRILSLDQIRQLKESIDSALSAYEDMLSMVSTKQKLS